MRESLIEAATATIARSGIDALALRGLAREVGTSTNAVYTMFGGKSGLVDEVLDRGRRSLFEAQTAIPATDDPLADFLTLGRAYRRWAHANPAMYAVIFSAQGAGVTLPEEGTLPHALQPLAAVLSRLIHSGIFRPEPLATLTLSTWAMVHGAVSLELDLFATRPRELADAAYEAHLHAGIRAWRA